MAVEQSAAFLEVVQRNCLKCIHRSFLPGSCHAGNICPIALRAYGGHRCVVSGLHTWCTFKSLCVFLRDAFEFDFIFLAAAKELADGLEWRFERAEEAIAAP